MGFIEVEVVKLFGKLKFDLIEGFVIDLCLFVDVCCVFIVCYIDFMRNL